jgi:hypothetical protein
MISSLATLEGDEAFELSSLGAADDVSQERVCDEELIVIRGPKARTAASIILRYVHCVVVVLFVVRLLLVCYMIVWLGYHTTQYLEYMEQNINATCSVIISHCESNI